VKITGKARKPMQRSWTVVHLSSEKTEQNELCEKKREKEFFKCPLMTDMLMTPAELVSSAGLVCWRLFN